MRLSRGFFARPTLKVAAELLGAEFCFGDCAGIITEVEAYLSSDPASHSFGGQTQRNAVMFGPAGHLYVYFTYGKYFCLNFVTEAQGQGAAVLLRGIQPTRGLALMAERRQLNLGAKNLTNGPAKICQAFGINLAQNGCDFCQSNSRIYLVARKREPQFKRTPRIGISKAKAKFWRFVVI